MSCTRCGRCRSTGPRSRTAVPGSAGRRRRAGRATRRLAAGGRGRSRVGAIRLRADAREQQREDWMGSGVGDGEPAVLGLRERARQRKADAVAIARARSTGEGRLGVALQAGPAVGDVDRRSAGASRTVTFTSPVPWRWALSSRTSSTWSTTAGAPRAGTRGAPATTRSGRPSAASRLRHCGSSASTTPTRSISARSRGASRAIARSVSIVASSRST